MFRVNSARPFKPCTRRWRVCRCHSRGHTEKMTQGRSRKMTLPFPGLEKKLQSHPTPWQLAVEVGSNACKSSVHKKYRCLSYDILSQGVWGCAYLPGICTAASGAHPSPCC